MLGPIGICPPVACDVQSSRVVFSDTHAVELVYAQLLDHVVQVHSSFAQYAREISSASTVNCAVNFRSEEAKLIGPPASINKYPEVDLKLSGVPPSLRHRNLGA